MTDKEFIRLCKRNLKLTIEYDKFGPYGTRVFIKLIANIPGDDNEKSISIGAIQIDSSDLKDPIR